MKLVINKNESIKKYFYVIEDESKIDKISIYFDKKEIPKDIENVEEHYIEYSRPNYQDFLEYIPGLTRGLSKDVQIRIIVRLLKDWSIVDAEGGKLKISYPNFLESILPTVADAITYLVQEDLLIGVSNH